MLTRPLAGAIPDAPGSYQFRDRDGRVIYVGKAKSLRQRLSNYFGDPGNLPPRTAQMVACAESVEWIQVRNDVEALMLEYSLIKQHKPRFNVRLRDDKSYPFLVVTLADEWPRAAVRRGRPPAGTRAGARSGARAGPRAGEGAPDGDAGRSSVGAATTAGSANAANRYFGPYAHAYAIRETFDLLLRVFPIRSCSDAKFARHQRLGRPCLLYHIERCSGPCADLVDAADYAQIADDFVSFIEGDTAPVVRRLEEGMREAAANLEFELAARLRDRLASVRKASEKQQMVTERAEDLDCFGLAEDELEVAVQVFYVRRGRVVGRKGFLVDKVEDLDGPQLLAHVLQQHYSEAVNGVPPLVLVPGEIDEAELMEEWLSGLRAGGEPGDGLAGDGEGAAGGSHRRGPQLGEGEWWAARKARRPERSVNPMASAGTRSRIHVPRRGEKKALLDVLARNAREELARYKLKRRTDHNARARALNALQDALGLPEAPLRIECYDMSHLQGSDYVGSMVVMEDGLPRPFEYKRFKVRSAPGNDDYAAMEEVLTRRLTAYLEERQQPVGDRRRRFSYPPQLLLVDGGKGQLGVAVRVLENLGLDEEIPAAALAKQFEEVYVPGASEPVRTPRGSEALYLLQQVRDEAHRFAVSYHRNLRGKRMTASVLDGVRGLGPVRRRRLVAELGGVKAVKEAPLDKLASLPWLPEAVAKAVWEKIHGAGPAG